MAVELHALSAFSFLEGASLPEDLAARAAELGLTHLALTDRDGVYGAGRFHAACRAHGVTPLYGAEVTLGPGSPLPRGSRPVLLARTDAGWSQLTRLLSESQLSTPKGEARLDPRRLEGGDGGLACLTGSYHRGPLHEVLAHPSDPAAVDAAVEILAWLAARFPGHLYVELVRHGLPQDPAREQVLVEAAGRLGLPLVAGGDVHHARPEGRRLQDVLTCVRHHTTLDAAGRRLYPNGERYLRGPDALARRFADRPEALANARRLAEGCTSSLDRLAYRFPDFELPEGVADLDAWLEVQVAEGARHRFGEPPPAVRRQLTHELGVIRRMGLAGYFLVVWDVVRFCRSEGILCQGRGSAANSVVCYCLGITSVDPVGMDLLFERFLSEERKETPDIDLDIEHERREEVIQYVYRRYGRHRAAMVNEVITYRGRSAVRDVGKALGLSLDQVDVIAKSLDRTPTDLATHLESHGFPVEEGRIKLLQALVEEIQRLPRHVSIHVGGMVITEGRLDEVVPVEAAAMAERSVIQWDKDDCGELGIIKIDLLGLGMLTLLRKAFELVRRHEGVELDLASIPQGDARVYDLLCAADTLGVFQVESRAQMATLPRLRPRNFYDLAVEVALIRPGPIQGDMVHPYLRRRAGEEPVTYLHPSLEPILKRTLGVPLFQEQGMKVAVAAAGFTNAQADALRRAMGFRRATAEMEAIRTALTEGMDRNGIEPEVQARIIAQITAFSSYGFPESHALSFAVLVYASAWLRVHHPAAFYAALLNSQPMGFYAPASIVHDALRHGVPVRPVDVAHARYHTTLEPLDRDPDADQDRPVGGHPLMAPPSHAVRLGYRTVRGIGEAHEAHLEREVDRGPFTDLVDFARRARLSPRVLSNLAAAGAFRGFGLNRRTAMWRAGVLLRDQGELFRGHLPDAEDGVWLPAMDVIDRVVADHATTGLTTETHPMALLRPRCEARGALTASELTSQPAGRRVRVAGQVTIRQRPGTAKGMVFLTLEDETGMAAVAVQPHVYERYRPLVRDALFLFVEGVVQRDGVTVSVTARSVEPLTSGPTPAARSRDFH